MSITIPFVHRENPENAEIWLKALKAAMPGYRICELNQLSDVEITTVEVAIVANPNPADLAGLTSLKWVQSLWAGVERIVAEIPNAPFEIVRLEDPQLAESMSEAVLTCVLDIHRDMPRYRQQQTNKVWKPLPTQSPSERCVGILGLGHLGTAAAQRLAHNKFKVVGWSRTAKTIAGIETFSGASGMTEVTKRSNILVVLLPLTDQTRGLLDHPILSTLPRGATLINFARGPIIDERALLDHLDKEHLHHAILDVFDREPLPTDSPFWSHANVTVLPHISAPTNRATASAIAAHNIGRFVEGGGIPKNVDRALGY